MYFQNFWPLDCSLYSLARPAQPLGTGVHTLYTMHIPLSKGLLLNFPEFWQLCVSDGMWDLDQRVWEGLMVL